MHIKDVEKLKAWLLKRLSPLCDADPAALSKYIVALLRKEKPRSALKELCINQLEVFLAKETPSFVDHLFLSLDNESYLNGSKDSSPRSPTAQGGRPQPTTTNRGISEHRRITDDTRHREVDDDDRDFRRSGRSRHGSPLSVNDNIGQRKRRMIEVEPPKRSIRQRLGPKEDEHRNNRRPHPSSRKRSQSRSRSSTPEYEESSSSASDGRKRTNSDTSKPTKRQRCKDYDEKGMCLLGEQCPFDHGIDPVVITGPLPPPYPPPPHFPPLGLPAQPPSIPNTSNGGLILSTDCYNPEEPSINPTPSAKGLPHPSLIPPPPFIPPPPGVPAVPPPTATPTISNHMGGATGPVSKPSGNVKTPFRLSDTLVLRKIPKELNTITKLSGHFEKFGTIVNLQVRYENDPESAIVQFTTPQEARKAHDSTEAVLNNRFIKVYYLKNTGQSPYTAGQKENFLKTSTPEEIALQVIRPPGTTSANMTTSTTETTPITTQTTPTQPIPSHTVNKQKQSTSTDSNEPSVHMKKQLARQEALHNAAQKRLELQKKSQSLLEAQITQQKLLLSKLEKCGNTLSSEERSKVIDTLKSLSSSITKHKQTLSSASKTAHVKPHNATPTNTAPPTRHNPSSTSSDSLQQTAENLRNEARQLGILPGASPWSEGEGDLRSKLESKTRQLLVINSVNDKDLLIKYFESFGGLNQVEVDPNSSRNLIFTFRNRTIAEKAAQGSIFKGKPLIMKWYDPKPSTQTVNNTKEEEKHQQQDKDDSNDKTATDNVKPPVRTVSISNEIDVEGLLDDGGDSLIDVLTPPNQPRVVHLLDDDEDEEDRSWRR